MKTTNLNIKSNLIKKAEFENLTLYIEETWAGGFKERNCYGWQATYGQSHWMPKSIRLPESFHFYYEHDAKVAEENAMIEAQEPAND